MALASCTPALQADSQLKVATATSASTPTSQAVHTGYIDCFGEPVVKPASLSLNCVDDSRRLVDISWTLWTPSAAEGTATLIDGEVRTANIPVKLSSPIGLVFTDLEVDGELMYP